MTCLLETQHASGSAAHGTWAQKGPWLLGLGSMQAETAHRVEQISRAGRPDCRWRTRPAQYTESLMYFFFILEMHK